MCNLYSEEAIHEVKEETKNIGVEIQGKTIKMFRFADDTALLLTARKEFRRS